MHLWVVQRAKGQGVSGLVAQPRALCVDGDADGLLVLTLLLHDCQALLVHNLTNERPPPGPPLAWQSLMRSACIAYLRRGICKAHGREDLLHDPCRASRYYNAHASKRISWSWLWRVARRSHRHGGKLGQLRWALFGARDVLSSCGKPLPRHPTRSVLQGHALCRVQL